MPSLKLKAFQEAGRDFLAGSRCAILADGLGLGKTPQAIMAARALSARRILVVAPLSTLPGLAGEIRRWWPESPPIRIARRDQPLYDLPGWTLIPWTDLALRRLDTLASAAASPYDLAIADEVHTARSVGLDGSKTANAWYGTRTDAGIATIAPRTWGLSATIMPNGRPIELLPLFDWVDAFASGTARDRFMRKHCRRVTKFGSDMHGANHLDEIHAYLKRCGWYLRREPADVPGELPDLQRIPVPIPLAAQPAPVPGDPSPELPPDDVMPGLEDWSRTRAALSLRKAPGACVWLDDWLASNPKQAIVMFTYHKGLAQWIAAHVGAAVLTGDDTPEHRQIEVDAFAKPDGPRVFVATMGACGTGINGLHKRTTICAFAEFDCLPGTHDQAEGRVRRIGGIAGGAFAYYLHAQESALDAHVANLLTRKRGWIDATLPADLTEEARALFA